jgi:hypothetical protein
MRAPFSDTSAFLPAGVEALVYNPTARASIAGAAIADDPLLRVTGAVTFGVRATFAA